MTIQNFAGILSGLSFPVAHYEFGEPTEAPCAVYLDGWQAVHGDSTNALDEYAPTVELYAKKGDHSAENELEELLRANGLTYTKDSAWVHDRQEIEYIYTIC